MEHKPVRAPYISIVVPCLNESPNIKPLYGEIEASMKGIDYECIFVNDGSIDNTFSVIKEISQVDNRIFYVSLTRNFGQQQALLAGMSVSRGKAVITMDADFQHPPKLLPQMISKWNEGFKVVATKRVGYLVPARCKRFLSRLFYTIMSYLVGQDVMDGSADFRLLDRCVVDALCGKQQRLIFLRSAIAWYGYRQATIEYEAPSRYNGKTKYGMFRMLALSKEAITSRPVKPLRLAAFLALILVMCSLLIGAVFYYVSLKRGIPLYWGLFLSSITFINCTLLLMIGLLCEYIWNLTSNEVRYVISGTNISTL